MDSRDVKAASDPNRYQRSALNDFTNIVQQQTYLEKTHSISKKKNLSTQSQQYKTFAPQKSQKENRFCANAAGSNFSNI
jgi:hypothetical protein